MDRDGYRTTSMSNGYSNGSCGKELVNLGDRTPFVQYKLGNQTMVIHEMNNRSEGMERRGRTVPSYSDVDDEHSDYGPKCIEDRPLTTNAVLFSCNPSPPLPPLELTLTRPNEQPTELRRSGHIAGEEDRHHSPNDEGKFRKMRRKIEKEKEHKRKNQIEPENQEGYIGRYSVDAILDLFGMPTSNTKSKKTGKSKGGRRKNKEKSVPIAAEDDGQDLDVEVELDTQLDEEPTPPPVERFEYALNIENPFFDGRTPDDQKKKRWFQPINTSALIDGKPLPGLVVTNSANKRMWCELRNRWEKWTDLSSDPPIYYNGEEEANDENVSQSRNSSSSSAD